MIVIVVIVFIITVFIITVFIITVFIIIIIIVVVITSRFNEDSASNTFLRVYVTPAAGLSHTVLCGGGGDDFPVRRHGRYARRPTTDLRPASYDYENFIQTYETN